MNFAHNLMPIGLIIIFSTAILVLLYPHTPALVVNCVGAFGMVLFVSGLIRKKEVK